MSNSTDSSNPFFKNYWKTMNWFSGYGWANKDKEDKTKAGGNSGEGLGMFGGSSGEDSEDGYGSRAIDRMRADNRSGNMSERYQAALQSRYGSPGGRGESAPPPVAFTPTRKEQQLKR